MSLFGLIGANNETSQNVNRQEIMSRYQRVRRVSMKLNNKLVERLSTEEINEGGQKIGMLKRGILVFDTEDQSSVLMDYCIYHVFRNGCNAIEKYLISFPPDSDTEEMICLRAMQSSIYSLFLVESVELGFGVKLRDARTNELHQVVDLGLGGSAQPGLLIASRLIQHDDFWKTGGAALPVGRLPKGQRESLMKQLPAVLKPNSEGNFDPATLIRTCLEKGSAHQVQYADMPYQAGQERQYSCGRAAKIGRNEPCPCGSGRKYKVCCINRR